MIVLFYIELALFCIIISYVAKLLITLTIKDY